MKKSVFQFFMTVGCVCVCVCVCSMGLLNLYAVWCFMRVCSQYRSAWDGQETDDERVGPMDVKACCKGVKKL